MSEIITIIRDLIDFTGFFESFNRFLIRNFYKVI